jgi:eukaryotic-like serine/threonine-protein kinase
VPSVGGVPIQALCDGAESMAEDGLCPKCGGVVPGDAPQGLCPECLMAFALGDEPAEPSSQDFRDPTLTFAPDLDRSTLHDEATLCPKAADPSDAPTIPPVAPTEPASTAPPSLGSVRYFGDYELISEIARGGMGVVYRAQQVNLNRTVALKMILAGQLAGPDDVKRFYREAEAAAGLDHLGIVPVFEVGQHQGQHYFSMGFVDGQSLAQKVAGGPLPPREAASLIRLVAEAVQFAHDRGVIHRDLKPANILLDVRGRPKVTDFGLAKKLQGDRGLTQTGQVMGTPSYMPPEQVEGKDVGPLADVYSLGALLYCLLTGRPPFQAASAMETLMQVVGQEPVPVRQLNPSVPRDLETICLKCLEKEPGRRYGSAAALAEDLRRCLGDEPIRARPSGRVERTWKWAKRRPAAAALVAVSVSSALLLIAGLATANVLIAARQATTERALDRERSVSYFQRIGLASGALRSNDVARADLALDDCPRDLRRWEWSYLKRLAHAEKDSWRGHPGGMESIDFSPDGSRLMVGGITWSMNGESFYERADVRQYDFASGKEAARPEAYSNWRITAVRYSPDGRRLLAADLCAGDIRDQDPGQVSLFDVKGGPPLVNIDGDRVKDRGMVLDAAFRPDGAWVALSTNEAFVKICETESGRVLRKLTVPEGGICGVKFRPDGAVLATAGSDGTVRLWDPADGRELRVLKGHRGDVNSVAFRPDGRRLASCGDDRTIRIWDPETGRDLRVVWGHGDVVLCVAFSPDGTRIASCGRDGSVRIWDPETGEELSVYRGHIRHVNALAYHPDGKTLASVGEDGTIKFWDVAAAPECRVLSGHKLPVGALAFSPDSKRLASIGKVEAYEEGGELRTWEVPSGRPLLAIAEDSPLSLSYSADGRSVAVAGASKRARVREATTGQVRLTLEGPNNFGSVAVSPDGSLLATGAQDQESAVELRDASTGVAIRRLAARTRNENQFVSVDDLVFHPDGRSVVACWGNDYEWSEHVGARCWDVATGRVLWTVEGPREGIFGMAFFPDGRRIAAASGRSRDTERPSDVLVWDATDGKTLMRLKGHVGAVVAVAVSPDGSRIASASLDRSIKIWDADSGIEVYTLRGHGASIRSLAFSPDGQYLASGDEDQIIRLWPATRSRIDPH